MKKENNVMRVEVGIMRCGALMYSVRYTVMVFRVWLQAMRNGYKTNKWYMICPVGSKDAIAHFGCLPASWNNANAIVKMINALADKFEANVNDGEKPNQSTQKKRDDLTSNNH